MCLNKKKTKKKQHKINDGVFFSVDVVKTFVLVTHQDQTWHDFDCCFYYSLLAFSSVVASLRWTCNPASWYAVSSRHVCLVDSKDPVHLVALATRCEEPGIVSPVDGKYGSLHAFAQTLEA